MLPGHMAPMRHERTNSLRKSTSGYLSKKGGFRKNWLLRWFDLRGGLLQYFILGSMVVQF